MPNAVSIWQRYLQGTLHIQLNWDTSNSALAVLATQRIAKHIGRLWFAGDVTTRGGYIEVQLLPKQKRWSLSYEPLSRAAIRKLRRTITNMMPSIAFWAEKDVRRANSKANHPSRGLAAA